jgi:hypothetical protein
VSGMYCFILIIVSEEGDSNLHMQGCQVCTVPFWSQYHKKRIPTCICRGVRYVLCICKLESPSSDTVIRMEQYIPDTSAYVSWNSLLVILWSEWHSTYLKPHSDRSITRRWFHLAYARVSGMYCSILITVLQEEDSNVHMQGCHLCTVPILWSEWHSTYLKPLHVKVGILFLW